MITLPAAQEEKGEQLLQSFGEKGWVPCSVCVSSSQLSNTEQGTTTINKIYSDNIQAIQFFTGAKVISITS